MDRTLLNDHQWNRIASLLPGKPTDPGRTATDNRLFLEAILFIARTGIPWRDLPASFGAWNSTYKRFARWCETGVWEQMFAELSRHGDFDVACIDSSVVRAHQHAAGAQKKRAIKLLGALAAG
jgi:transposase